MLETILVIAGIVAALAVLAGLGYWMYCLFWKDIEKTAVTLFAKLKKRTLRWVDKHIEEDGKKKALKAIGFLEAQLKKLKAEIQEINYIK